MDEATGQELPETAHDDGDVRGNVGGDDAVHRGGAARDALPAQKQELRIRLRAERRARYSGTEGAARRAAEAAALRTAGDPLIERSRERPTGAPLRVAAFHPTPTEADVLPMVRALAEHGAELLFPAAAGEELDWIRWDGRSDFVPSPGRGFGREPDGERLGLEAVESVDLVLAPALAVDLSGTRIGHGGGYYDRALSRLPVTTEVLVVVHPHEVLPAGALPRGPRDVPVVTALTAEGSVCLTTP